MKNGFARSPYSGEQFNTLVQSGTQQIKKATKKPTIIVNGSGTLVTKVAMDKRAKKKTITQPLVLELINVAEAKGRDKKHIKSYWNTWHCQSKIHSFDGKIFGKYCKTRICPVCCGIRKAEIINKYLPVIKEWETPHFVTLTIKAVPANLLDSRVKEMNIAFRKIKDKYRKWHTKGKSIKLMGVKSLECNFNAPPKTYNPHFHIIVPNRATANLLKQEWCKYWGGSKANSQAQDIREIYDPENCLVETIKYGTKIFTDPSKQKNTDKKASSIIYVSAIDNIIWAMKPHRIFERFGFNLPTKPKIKGGKSQTLSEYDEWEHDPKQNDWVNTKDADQLLTGYVITGELLNILENNIDTELE